MGIFVGQDVGSVSAKLAAIWDFDATLARSLPPELPPFFRASSKAEENAGGPALPAENILGMRVTGSGAQLAAAELNATAENEFKAIACSMGRLYPDVHTMFEIGGESSKYLRLAESGDTPQATGLDAHTYATGIADYSTSGECERAQDRFSTSRRVG